MNVLYDGLKDVAGILKKADKIPEYEKILEVQEKLLEMQKNILDLETENRDLKERISIKENLLPEGNMYYLIKDQKKDGPYCTCCYDSNNKLVRLHSSPNTGSVSCPSCKTYVAHGQAQIIHSNHNWSDSNR